MSGEQTEDSAEVQSVTIQLANLDITITVRPSRPAGSAVGPSSSYTASAAPVGSVALTAPPDPADFSTALEERAIAASGPAECAALPLPFLSVRQGQLRAQHPQWTAAARAGRAFRAGVIAARRLAGEYLEHTSPSIPNRNTVYIALRGISGQQGEHGFWTTDYNIYARNTQIASGFPPQSISHAFATRAET